MKTSTCFLSLWLATASWGSQADELPVVFARSDRTATLAVRDDYRSTHGPLILSVFGRPLGQPTTVQRGCVSLVAPTVRVPTVFRLQSTHAVQCELIVYPDRDLAWDKDTALAAVQTPDWFNTWCDAVGLPVERFRDVGHLDAANWHLRKGAGLLVLGAKTGQDGLAHSCDLAVGRYKTNLLILETDWHVSNTMGRRRLALSPKDTTGALSDLRDQAWPLPPAFRQRTLLVRNRQTWVTGPDHPLVEEIRTAAKGAESLRTVVSYLPWQQQLGRCEMADELFLRLLRETARGAKDRAPLDRRWSLLYPEAKDIKSNERPVLAAALKSAMASVGSGLASPAVRAYVLDLRGRPSPPAELVEGYAAVKKAEARIGVQSPLAILGDHPILDTWKWLAVDGSHHRSPRPGVVWLPDNALPPSTESQLRLMQLFTEWSVSLEDISEEVDRGNRKNEP